MPPESNYGVDEIEVHRGLDGVRKRIGMYVGHTGSQGIAHGVFEIVGNSMDEATNGHGKLIRVYIYKNNTIVVTDQGRGIPVGPHKSTPNVDTMTLLCTEMHSGGKFDAGKTNYSKGRVGVHGVGLGVVNAMSTTFEVLSFRNRAWNYQNFKLGKAVNPKPKVITIDKLGIQHPNVGTIVRWRPDLSLFDKGSKIDPLLIRAWLSDVSWLIGDVRLELHVEGQQTEVFHRPNGLLDRFNYELDALDTEAVGEPFIYHSDTLDVLIGWAQHDSEIIYSAVASVRTLEGGTHQRGLEAAITQCFQNRANQKDKFRPEFLRMGMIAVVNVKLDEPRFNSQDKVKLVSEEARQMVIDELFSTSADSLHTWLGKQSATMDVVLNRAIHYTSLYENYKADRKIIAEYKSVKKGKVYTPKGMQACTSPDKEERELFVVEGDSAGGSAKQGVDSDFQAVMPLSGKILNAYKKEADKLLHHDKIKDLLLAVGYDPDDPTAYQYGKLIIMTDADDDGEHIAALILGLFTRIMPNYVAAGRVFVAYSSLYVYRTNKGNVYGPSLELLRQNVLKAFPKEKFETRYVSRIKGLGELNPSELRESSMDPLTRKLARQAPPVGTDDHRKVIAALGKSVEDRTELIQSRNLLKA